MTKKNTLVTSTQISNPSEFNGKSSGLVRLANILDSVVDRFGQLAGWCVLAIVLVVSLDAIARFAFRIGTVGMQELGWHLVSPIALIGMSYGMLHNQHARVELVYEHLGPNMRIVIEFITALITIVVSVILVVLSLRFVETAYINSENSPDPGGLPYRFLLKSFIPLGFALMGVQGVAHAIRNGLKVFAGRANE